MEANKYEIPTICRMQREYCGLKFQEIHDKIDSVDTKIDVLITCVKGNGKIGLVMKVDRLEQARKRHVKLIWVLIGGVVALIANLAGHWIGV